MKVVETFVEVIHALEWTSLGLVGCGVGEIAVDVVWLIALPFEDGYDEWAEKSNYRPGKLIGMWWDEMKDAWSSIFE